MRLFCLQLEASCLQWSFLLTVDNFSFVGNNVAYSWSFLAYSFSFSAYSFSFSADSWSFFAYSGKVHLIRALRDCKQRSSNCKQKSFPRFLLSSSDQSRRRTNVQQLTCKIDSSNSFYYLFFSFVLLELKPLVLKGKVRGEKL